MAYVKYTREMLSEAVVASTSMAAVLRHLGVRQNGGAHAHIRRRIEKFGIDTSHFLGQAHFRGIPNPKRRRPDEVLILRPETGNREKPSVLRRALEEMGRPYRCTECGIGDTWNERPLVLHVDHIDGRLWDCRPDNVRFLCPNCHSQTPTYAGRKRSRSRPAMVRVDHEGNLIESASRQIPLTEHQALEVLSLVERKEITPSQAARQIGCSRGHIYKLLRRLAERGSIIPVTQRPPTPAADRDAIIAFALANPALGTKRIAAALGKRQPSPITVMHWTVNNILAGAGLNTREARAAAVAENRSGELRSRLFSTIRDQANRAEVA